MASAPVYSDGKQSMYPVLVQPSVPLAREPTRTTCPSCHAEILTTVSNMATTKTHLIAFLMCILGCFCCCCIPYCMKSCTNQKHTCPNCKAYIGEHKN
ncbi:unnamed protein product [Brassicogethes aeneus]|uniref:LITAF domain-containing protein n=1 Tax=Brassicogethes aeneus TaxID=1431903 RepID=A0A9P0FC25_BRAAE|nr:unnamed protein product [Brassicogethes aeneus]